MNETIIKSRDKFKIGVLTLFLLFPPSLFSISSTELISQESIIKATIKEEKCKQEDSKDLESIAGIDILSSVPKGIPIDKNQLRKSLPRCSGFGYRIHPIYKTRRMHKGIDLPAKEGVDIKSTSYGVVDKVVMNHPSYGNYVVIKSDEYEMTYAHCNTISVKKGERVTMGQIIATVGSTGLSTGPHCHYEIKKRGKHIDPKLYM